MSLFRALGETMQASRLIAILAATFFLMLQPVYPQQPAKVPRIGYVSGTGDAVNQGPYVEALRQGLLKLGYVEEKHFKIEFRGAEGQIARVPGLVKELLYLNVDILVLPIPTAIRAAKEATQTIPIVIVASLDPVATGLIDNLARPGGNITGISTLSQDLNGKRLELLKEVVPQLTRAGILVDFDPPGTAINLKDMKARHGLLKYRLKLLRCVV